MNADEDRPLTGGEKEKFLDDLSRAIGTHARFVAVMELGALGIPITPVLMGKIEDTLVKRVEGLRSSAQVLKTMDSVSDDAGIDSLATEFWAKVTEFARGVATEAAGVASS